MYLVRVSTHSFYIFHGPSQLYLLPYQFLFYVGYYETHFLNMKPLYVFTEETQSLLVASYKYLIFITSIS